MAAVTQLSFLLFALINNILTEELIIIQKVQDNYNFSLPEEKASLCLISRFVGGRKLVLWNTSTLWSENSAVPEDLKHRLSVVGRANVSLYMIQNLTHSDSGQYQEECWTEGNITYQRNISITICSSIDEVKTVLVGLGGTADLPCEGAADNLDILWLKREYRYEEVIFTRVFEDNSTPVMDSDKGRFQVVENTSALHVSSLTAATFRLYMCLVMNQQQCVSGHPVDLFAIPNVIYHSEEEMAVLQCPVADFSDDQPLLWVKWKTLFFFHPDLGQQNQTASLVDQNFSLVLSSLTLNHTGLYSCEAYISVQTYWLVVCPKFGPPVVELFSEGDTVTLRCRDWIEGMGFFWFVKSNQTEGRTLNSLSSDQRGRLDILKPNASVVNVSLEDTGEYWCAVFDSDDQCVAANKFLLKHRDPVVIHFTFYAVRLSLLSGLLMVLCAAVVVAIRRTRRGERRSSETDS